MMPQTEYSDLNFESARKHTNGKPSSPRGNGSVRGYPTVTSYVPLTTPYSWDAHSDRTDITGVKNIPDFPLSVAQTYLPGINPPRLVVQRNTKTKKRLRRVSACCKQFWGILLARVGLGFLVISYTLLGGFMFCAIERGGEIELKTRMVQNRKEMLEKLMRIWRDDQLELLRLLMENMKDFASFRRSVLRDGVKEHNSGVTITRPSQGGKEDGTHRKLDPKESLSGLSWYLAGLGWPRKIVPESWFSTPSDGIKPLRITHTPNTSTTRWPAQELRESIRAHNYTTLPNQANFSKIVLDRMPSHFVVLTLLEDLLPILVNHSLITRQKVQDVIDGHVRAVTNAIKDEGWNGKPSADELNWSVEGGILYAVTVLTTIGYGHVTPHTSIGKILTMMYALIGIPLFVFFVNNNGNYFAHAFRGFYTKVCRPATQCIKHCCLEPSVCRRRHTRTSVSRLTNQSRDEQSCSESLTHNQDPPESVSLHTNTPVEMSRYTRTPHDTPKLVKKRPSPHSFAQKENKMDHIMPLPIEHNTSMLKPRCDVPRTYREMDPPEQSSQPPSPYLSEHRSITLYSRRSSTSSCNSYLDSVRPSFRRPPNIYDKLGSRNEETSSNTMHETKEAVSIETKSKTSRQVEAKEEKVTVPITLTVFIMTVYILIGATVFSFWESPDYLKWSYFCFVTLSTIGFGDIVPGTKIDSENPKEKMIVIIIYVGVGLSVFTMCFKLMEEEVLLKIKRVVRGMKLLGRKRKRSQGQLQLHCQLPQIPSQHQRQQGRSPNREQ